jgi:membrane protein DedA with SNARE-associated domain
VFETLLKVLHDFWSGLVFGQLQQLGNWNYVLLALMTLLEGPIATLLGAMAASTGVLKPEWVFVAAAGGNLTADALWYSLGYLGKTEWLMRHGRRFGVTEDHVIRLENAMQKHARKILIVAKLTLSFSIPALIAAGLARVPWRRWFSTVVAGEILWTGSLVLIGYNLTFSLRRMEVGLQILAIAGIMIFAALVVRYLVRYGSHFSPPS